MIRLAATFIALGTFSVGAFAQQPATAPLPVATPKAAPAVKASPSPAKPARASASKSTPAAPTPVADAARPAVGKSAFEVVRVNPGSGPARSVQVETFGKTTTVRVGEPIVTREHLRSAATGTERMKVTSGPKPETRDVPVIRLTFTRDGARILTEASRAAQGELVAVLVDGKVVAMPKVTGPVIRPEWTITGNFTAESAKAIVARINASK